MALRDTTDGRARRPWLLLASGAVVAVATVVFIGVAIGAIRHRTVINRVFDRIELLVRADRVGAELDEALIDATTHARGAAEWVHILRFAWEKGSSPAVVVRVAESAYERHPNNELFHHVLRYMYASTGRTEEAAAMVPLESPGDLNAELTFLSGGVHDTTPLSELLAGAARGDARATVALGSAYGDPRLLENGAVLAAFAGDRATVDTARVSLEDLSVQTETDPRLAIILAAWTGDDDRLFSQFQRLEPRAAVDPDVLLMQGDAYVRQRQLELADAVYRDLIATAPSYSAIPYLNRSLILAARGDAEGALAATVRGYEVFPSDPRLLIRHVVDLRRLGRGDEAVKVLQEVDFSAIHTGLHDVERHYAHHLWLLSHALSAVRGPAERFETELWRYLNRYPEAHEVAAFLLAYLRFRNDDAGIRDLLSRYGESEAPWAVGFAAVEAARNGDYERADALFLALTRQTPPWEEYYNAALFAARHYPETERDERVDEIVRLVQRGELSDASRARFVMLRAEMARLSGFSDRAADLVWRAIELDPAAEGYRTYLFLVAGE